LLRGKEEPVTLAMTEGGLPEEYIGMPAADDIPRIEDAESWEDTWQTSYVTIEPIGIVSTGVGARHPWVSAYTSTRRGGQRHRPDVSDMAFDVLDEYGEYFLIQLPDQSYILAQMSVDDARALKAGKEIALPIGRKSSVYQQALKNMEDICKDYDVNTEGVFYCINDKWNEEHEFIVQLLRIGSIFLVALVLGSILIAFVDKVMKQKDE
ncbi:MAG: hypothetical protein K2H40_05175, partial [Lachnospiraceae bacterium]|nr:hypothetical protein [Lachnospiraceae bacterium]